jgi:hypothetical protein
MRPAEKLFDISKTKQVEARTARTLGIVVATGWLIIAVAER